MECLLSEIGKIQGERQADERIKACLLELYTRQQSIMDNMQFEETECCDCETEGKPLVAILDSDAKVRVELADDEGDDKDVEQDEIKSDS